MLYFVLSITALTTYLCAGGYLLHLLVKRLPLEQPWLFAMAACATALHGAGLLHLIITASGINFSIAHAFSLLSFSINTIVVISSLRKSLHNLLILLLPASVFAIAISMITANDTTALIQLDFGIGSHVILSLLAYSLLTITTFQALLVHWQNKRLKARQFNGLMQHLPALETMEALMFELLCIGVILLALGIGVGVIYLDDIFAQHLVHKTILSIGALIIFSTVLLGRALKGWRGNQAVRWILGGFCALMLAYFGSKLVLEVILV